jgi:hypothetical protein
MQKYKNKQLSLDGTPDRFKDDQVKTEILSQFCTTQYPRKAALTQYFKQVI